MRTAQSKCRCLTSFKERDLTPCEDEVSLILARAVLVKIGKVLRSTLSHHVSVEVVKVVLSVVHAWIGGIERDSVLVITVVIIKVSNERQIVSRLLVL